MKLREGVATKISPMVKFSPPVSPAPVAKPGPRDS